MKSMSNCRIIKLFFIKKANLLRIMFHLMNSNYIIKIPFLNNKCKQLKLKKEQEKLLSKVVNIMEKKQTCLLAVLIKKIAIEWIVINYFVYYTIFGMSIS